jgi:putative methyltransferase (TIGR04325 family)
MSHGSAATWVSTTCDTADISNWITSNGSCSTYLKSLLPAGKLASGLPNISFMNKVEDFAESRLDILLASGSMQYLASPARLLQNMLDRRIRPSHVLINRLPLYGGPQFVTLQNGGLVYYPQYVFNRETFINSIENLGYGLVDAWPDTADSCVIPFHPARSIATYTGLYFQTAEDTRARQALARNSVAGKMIGTT